MKQNTIALDDLSQSKFLIIKNNQQIPAFKNSIKQFAFGRSSSFNSYSVTNLQKSIRRDVPKSVIKNIKKINQDLRIHNKKLQNKANQLKRYQTHDNIKSLVPIQNISSPKLKSYSSVQVSQGSKLCHYKQQCGRNSFKKFVPFVNQRHLGKLLSKQKVKQLKEDQHNTFRNMASSIRTKEIPAINKQDFYNFSEESNNHLVSQERHNFQLKRKYQSVGNLRQFDEPMRKRGSFDNSSVKIGVSTQLANKLNFKNFRKVYQSTKRQIFGVYSSLTRRCGQDDLIAKQQNDRRWKVSYVTDGKEISLPYGQKISDFKRKVKQQKSERQFQRQKMRISATKQRLQQSGWIRQQSSVGKLDEFLFKRINQNLPPQQCKNPESENLFNRFVEVCQFSQNLRRAELIGKHFL